MVVDENPRSRTTLRLREQREPERQARVDFLQGAVCESTMLANRQSSDHGTELSLFFLTIGLVEYGYGDQEPVETRALSP
jgi:hypothetical protein